MPGFGGPGGGPGGGRGPGGPGGPGGGGFGGGPGGFGGGPGGFGGGGHRPPPPRGPYRRGCCLPGCMMYVLGAGGIVALLAAGISMLL